MLVVGLFFGNTVAVSASIDSDRPVAQQQQNVSESEYQKNISGVKLVNSTELVSLINSKSSYILYVGRAACSHCRNFSTVLKEYIPSAPKTIYYVDLDNSFKNISSDESQVIQKFMSDSEVEYTPTLLDMANGEVQNEFVGDQVSLADLANMKD